MLISNLEVHEDGTYDFDFKVEQNECAFLMDFAVKELIRRGVFTLAVEEAEQELDLLKQAGEKLN